jgi:hypothetical protein
MAVFEALGFEKDTDSLGFEFVASNFDTSCFDVFAQLRKNKIGITRWGSEGFHFLDRMMIFSWFVLEVHDTFATKFLPDFYLRFGEVLLDPVFTFKTEVESSTDTILVEEGGVLRPDTPDITNRELIKIKMDVLVRDGSKTIGFLPFGAYLGEDLGRSETNREGEAKLLLEFCLNLLR